MMIINEIELACKLADTELRKKWQLYREDGVFIPVDVEVDGCLQYSEEAQELFDILYDKYLNMINECQEGEKEVA